MGRIVIVGGGFAGLFTALNLERYHWPGERPEVLLVDRAERFVFAPLLYELVSGELKTWEVAPRFADLLEQTQIRFKQAEVSGIDLENQKVLLGDGTAEPYDQLVLTAGGSTPVEIVSGAREHALAFRTLEDAERLINRLKFLLDQGADPVRVALVGGGASGVELACKLADTLRDKGSILLVDREKEILPQTDAMIRKAACAQLERRGIRLNLQTKILSVQAEGLETETTERSSAFLPADVVLWTVGTTVPKLVRDLDLPKDERGRIRVLPTLQVVDHPEIFALGDLAAAVDAQGHAIGASAQVAFQQADYSAWNLWAESTGRPLLAFRYYSLGMLLSLGVDSGVASLAGMQVEGPLAYLIRRIAYLLRMPTSAHRLRVGLNWAATPVLDWLQG
ncbi:MAG: NAD(P)/FAD-dependent oxidoreductase [Gemmatimonadaceae bacterium]|nr:NAD(P)/FAD-dependent oxidoreductase [Gloeobacterales cyanobacterium ES-bin-141]